MGEASNGMRRAGSIVRLLLPEASRIRRSCHHLGCESYKTAKKKNEPFCRRFPRCRTIGDSFTFSWL
jgi:hypothetical protein